MPDPGAPASRDPAVDRRTELTDITFLLDRSGSMFTIHDQVVAGFAEFIADRRAEPGECVVSLYQFSDRCEEVYVARPLATVGPLELEPCGNTALRDAIGEVVTATRLRLAGTRPSTVVVGIITDGQDNRSRRYTHAAVRELIEAREAVDGWEFYYLGANQDAIEVGSGLGVDAGRSLSYAPHKVAHGTKALSRAVGRSRRASAPAVFTDQERDRAR